MQIECQNLTVGYDGRAILKDINFTVNRGDYLCIIGEMVQGRLPCCGPYWVCSPLSVGKFCW